MQDKSEIVECSDENHEKIEKLSGNWKERRIDIFPQLTLNTMIYDMRAKQDLALELALWLKEGEVTWYTL
jgi:hypothetical protein